MQAFNQLFLELYALILASIFIGTTRLSETRKADHSKIYWMLSIGMKALSFVIWGLIPYLPNQFLTVATFFFIASAVSMALLFRSWHTAISRTQLTSLAILMVIFTVVFEILRQQENSFQLRMMWAGGISMLISLWELAELRKNLRIEVIFALKSIFFVIFIQITFSLLTVALTQIHSSPQTANITLIPSTTNPVFWITMTLHLIIYIFIGSYQYQKLAISENKVSQEKQTIENLLTERESMITSLMMANRAASAGALSAALAHELSQPLLASLLNSTVLKRKLDQALPVREELQETAEKIARENKRASDILMNLKNIFMQEHSELSHHNIIDVLRNLEALVLPEAKRRQIDLYIAPIGRPLVARLNFGEFQQVMVNIINNAIEAIDAGGSVDRKIFIIVTEKPETIEVSVSDTGPGIPTEDHATVFELMKTSKNSGMGIGLWLCKHIIEQRHEGNIRLTSPQGQGANFTIALPKTSQAGLA